MLFFSLLLGKISLFLIQKIKGTSGSTWPGHLVIERNHTFIETILKKNKNLKVVFIAGTNGKTTTTKALAHILSKNGIAAIHNDAGANLLNGLASILIREASLTGKLSADALLFEVDENSFPLILDKIRNPEAVILLNLFRDQLDRYGEVNITSEKWMEALKGLSNSTVVIANADDPQIAFIAHELKTKREFYSIDDTLKTEAKTSHAADSLTCPNCRHELVFSKVSYSHVGNYRCPSCAFSNPKAFKSTIQTNLKGIFNQYNLTAAVLTAKLIFKIDSKSSIHSLVDFTPAFGRQEEIYIKDKKVVILLSKNPTGFNESLKVITGNTYSTLLLLLNDRIPDGRDISWIWDVDFEVLKDKKIKIIVGGDRAFDLANRLSYEDIDITAEQNADTAIKLAISHTKSNETLAILPTYSAMLEVRQLLTGKNIL